MREVSITDGDSAAAPKPGPTTRVTVGQAVVRFLASQHVERDGEEQPFFAGVAGIFGHGNLAGIGQALLQEHDRIRYLQARSEQAMVHIAVGLAWQRRRLGAMACTTSIGPGATNMLTGAALATVNRLPVLLLPSDAFATRLPGPVLQELESPWSQELSVNDSFKAVSRYWDRINRPEQLPTALLEAMRVLTSPAETGAVTLALPQDVQAEAFDFPAALFERRVWHVPRSQPDLSALDRAVEAISGAERPVVIAGGGVHYSDAATELAALVEAGGIPVAETQAGKGSLSFDHPLCLGSAGVSGSAHGNALLADADVVIGVGTRYTDFTTASKTLFAPGATFVNVNVTELDGLKHAGIGLVGDAREALRSLLARLDGWSAPKARVGAAEAAADSWREEVQELIAAGDGEAPTQAEIIGAVNRSADPQDVVVCAAGSLPGDLHRLWCSRRPHTYHVEYGFSCMGYEVAGALGVKLAEPPGEVYAMVGDGSWLMLSQDISTAVQEGRKLIVVLVDNHGYGSIAALSRASGSQGFGTKFALRGEDGLLSGPDIPLDLPANARSLGAEVLTPRTTADLEDALTQARAGDRTTVVYVEAAREGRFGGSGAWWDVPIAEVSTLDSTKTARGTYRENRSKQRWYL